MQRSGFLFFPSFLALNIAGFSKIVRHVLAFDMSRNWANVFGRMTRILGWRPLLGLWISNKNWLYWVLLYYRWLAKKDTSESELELLRFQPWSPMRILICSRKKGLALRYASSRSASEKKCTFSDWGSNTVRVRAVMIDGDEGAYSHVRDMVRALSHIPI